MFTFSKIDISNIFIILFLVGTIFSFLIENGLEVLNFYFRKKHGKEIPENLKEHFDEQTIEKTILYENAKFKLGLQSEIFSLLLPLYLVFSGFYPAVFAKLMSYNLSTFMIYFLFLIINTIPAALISIPFSLYSEFGIEKQFGFSKMTIPMWITDTLKSILISLILSAPLIFVILTLFKYFSTWWWLLLGIVFVGFSLIISVIYPLFIAPLFNKFSPLPDGELKTRLETLLNKCGFKASGLFVMDASRRSGHSNAYFTGFGKSKRVVLFDTLINQLTVDELEAVLGHELGHCKKHHILKKLVLMLPLTFLMLFVISLFINSPTLYKAFGFSGVETVTHQMLLLGLVLLNFSFSGLMIFVTPLSNFLSRIAEFEADTFSKNLCGTGEHLISALVKLNKENLHQLQVPSLYSIFNYSHPPLTDRINNLK